MDLFGFRLNVNHLNRLTALFLNCYLIFFHPSIVGLINQKMSFLSLLFVTPPRRGMNQHGFHNIPQRRAVPPVSIPQAPSFAVF